MHRQSGRLVDDQHQPVAVEHTRLDFLCGQLGNIEQWQVFRLLAETANTPVRRIWHSLSDRCNGQANAKSAALAKIQFLVPFIDLNFLTELAARV